ncbi:MAG: hypothetical protein ABL925_00285 [Methylococcales bacterium]
MHFRKVDHVWGLVTLLIMGMAWLSNAIGSSINTTRVDTQTV